MKKPFLKTIGLIVLLLSTVGMSRAADYHGGRSHGGPVYDVVIVNGGIVDGSGNPWYYGDIGIKAGKIVKIGRIDLKAGKRSIDAKGMIVSPGFIDLHTHTDRKS